MKHLKFFLLFFILTSALSLPLIGFADDSEEKCLLEKKCEEKPAADQPGCLESCKKTAKPIQLNNPLGEKVTNISMVYGRVIYAFLGMSGAVALIMFIIGGFSWMTAAGNEEKVTKGKQTLLWAVLGLVVIFSSYAILRTIFESLNFNN